MAYLTVTHKGLGSFLGAPSVPQSAVGKKWHPGYYYAVVYVNARNLSAAITSTETSLPIGTTALYPASGFVWIDNERIAYTGKTSTNLTGCTRGTQGTAAAAHALGANVRQHKTMKKILSGYSSILTELNTHSSLRGLVIRYNWRDIETDKDVYDFSVIDSVLNDLTNPAIMTNGSKRVVIMIELRTDETNQSYVPDYIKNNVGANYDTGQWAYTGDLGTSGFYPRLWQTNTKNRFKLMLEAIVAKYKDNPYVEMFKFAESSVGTAIAQTPSVPGTYRADYINGMVDCVLHMNTLSDTTIVSQMLNYPRDIINQIIPTLVANGVGLGTANAFEDEPGIHIPTGNKGIFELYKLYKNQVPICPDIQKPEMFYSNLTWSLKNYKTGIADDGTPPSGGTVPNPTFLTITNWLKQAAYDVNYIFVTRAEFASGTSNITGNFFYEDFLTFMNLPAQTAVVTGGLNTTKPSKYPIIIGD